MRRKTKKIFGRLTALLLTVCMLCACSVQRAEAPSSATENDLSYPDTLAAKEQKKFDELTESLFKKEIVNSTIDLHFNLADPKAYGITEIPITFGEFSLDAIHEDMEELKELQSNLKGIDKSLLTEDQKLTYQILSSYIKIELTGEGMELYMQPLTSTIGIQAQLPVLLAEYAFYDKGDVEDYLSLLSQIDVYYGQIMDFEKQKSEAGLFMSDTFADHVLESCKAYLLPPEESFLTETFNTRLEGVEGLSQEEKDVYKARNLEVLQQHFIPAYQLLVDGLTALKGSGTNEKGLCYYPDGKKYYQYLIASNTGTSYSSVKKLKAAIEGQIKLDLNSMSTLMREHPETLDMLGNYSFSSTEPSEILEDLKVQITEDFPPLPENQYTVKYVPEALQNSLSPAFYLTPPLDRYHDNVIYINGGEQFRSQDLYTTLAHEGYPGHLYQNVYFIHHNTCNLRQIMSFQSYSEGWATYVENEAYKFQNGLDPYLGELLSYNSSAALGLHALLDININYEGWDKDQVREYLSLYYDVDGTDVVDSIYNAMVENPTNYLEYYVGYLEILNMRRNAENTLGDQFNAKEFNQFILDIGPAPFGVIKSYFRDWIEEAAS